MDKLSETRQLTDREIDAIAGGIKWCSGMTLRNCHPDNLPATWSEIYNTWVEIGLTGRQLSGQS
jgi:hypothetical protein